MGLKRPEGQPVGPAERHKARACVSHPCRGSAAASPMLRVKGSDSLPPARPPAPKGGSAVSVDEPAAVLRYAPSPLKHWPCSDPEVLPAETARVMAIRVPVGND